jgi:fatty-acyl-CoA synthase
MTTGLLTSVRRDLQYLGTGARILMRMRKMLSNDFTAANLIEQWAERTPDKEAIRFEGRSISYAELDAAGNRFAQWARGAGVGHGDVVAVLMENRPDYMACWLGLAKVGAIGALINTNLTGGPLAHCLQVSDARHLVLGEELRDSYLGVRDQLETQPEVWLLRDDSRDGSGDDAPLEPGWHDLGAALAACSSETDRSLRKELSPKDKLFYIYTSGTTGNPKAANISHHRFLYISAAFSGMARASAQDRMYVVLPLYHSAGGMCAVGLTFAAGGTVVLRRRFSASQFWEDCRREGVTLFQYIGELCRYLLNVPPEMGENEHQLRLCIGNGLRPDIWEEFQDRFAIPQILEFYGATEGNVALFNADGKVGAIGRMSPLMQRIMKIKLVRFDDEKEEPMRGRDGFCIECATGEPGEAIGLIPKDPNAPVGHFEGYTDEKATAKKVLRDVFEKGDSWFRTGDLMRRDAEGYFYFVDRIGDTFRWKGENVSTNEVSEVLGRQPGVREANVYGVDVPGADGRAGMASLVVDPDFDLKRFREAIHAELAAYARPLFIRLQREMEITGTFKHRKVDLVKDGFDPQRIPDLLYFDDPESGAFVTLDVPTYERIVNGQVRI